MNSQRGASAIELKRSSAPDAIILKNILRKIDKPANRKVNDSCEPF